MRSLLFSLLLCSPALAQTVWTVPNGADVNPFIANASPGDILQLGAQHPGFTLNKGLAIVGHTNITAIAGPYPWAPGVIQVAVPAGERASLMRLLLPRVTDGYSWYSSSLTLQSGRTTVADVTVAGSVTIAGGSHILQRLTTTHGAVSVTGGICEITDANLNGLNAGGFPPWGSTTALSQTGGTLVASRLLVVGGHGMDSGGSMPQPPLPGATISAGTAYFTDCAFTGGSGTNGPSGTIPGAAALVGSSGVAVARTTLTAGAVGVGAPSSGYQQVPTMVGMSCLAAPVRGAAFTVTATAGDSQGLLAILGGFDATPNTVAPIVEPLFGVASQLVVVTWALPAPAAQVAHTVNVPNLAGLYGVDVWLQAVQWTATDIRASTVVGGTIR